MALSYNQMVVDELSESAVDRLFQALADATRRDILRRAVSGGLSVTRLAGAYEISFAAVQKHVAVLSRAGLVTTARSGRELLVTSDPEALRAAHATLDRLESEWRGRVGRMSALLGESATELPIPPTKGQDR